MKSEDQAEDLEEEEVPCPVCISAALLLQNTIILWRQPLRFGFFLHLNQI